jgi:predicted metal-dependent peptidase
LINQVVQDTYQFVFVIENQDDEKYTVKNKTYFMLKKSRKEMLKIKKKDGGDVIIDKSEK